MKYKYANSSYKPLAENEKKCSGRPKGRNPSQWMTGPDPLTHDKHYAYLKHRSQAIYRGDDYNLTWEDWQELWPDELFLQRGRSSDSLCLMLVDRDCAWDMDNVEMVTRAELTRRTHHGERNKC